MYYVYILFSEKYNSFYVGQTGDLNNRIERHNSGIEKATARYIPWILKWSCEKSTRAEAMELERKLKNLSKQKLIQFIKKYS
jgi:putative endonuclease